MLYFWRIFLLDSVYLISFQNFTNVVSLFSGLYFWWEGRDSLYHDAPACDISFFHLLISGLFSSYLAFSSLTIICLRVVFFLFIFLEVGLESLWFSSNLRKFSVINSWKNVLPHFLFSGPPLILSECSLRLSSLFFSSFYFSIFSAN